MAYVKSIGLVPGEKIYNAIDTYLKYLDIGVTEKDTVINFNGNDYPVGYFDKNNIDLFKLGFTTISNDIGLLTNDVRPDSEEFIAQGRYFAEQVFDTFGDDLDSIEDVLVKFDGIMSNRTSYFKGGSVPMYDQVEWDKIETLLEEKSRRANKL